MIARWDYLPKNEMHLLMRGDEILALVGVHADRFTLHRASEMPLCEWYDTLDDAKAAAEQACAAA